MKFNTLSSAALCGTIAVCMGVMMSCGGREYTPDVQLSSLTTYDDSLTYFTGAHHGKNLLLQLDSTANREELLRGMRDVLLADVDPAGFHDGVVSGLRVADYFNGMHEQGVDFNRTAFMKAYSKVLSGGALSAQELDSVKSEHDRLLAQVNKYFLAKFRAERRQRAMERAAEAKANAAAGSEYVEQLLATNKNVASTESGLMYEVLQGGEGRRPSSSSSTKVGVIYTGTFTDGSTFASSEGEVVTFELGQLVPGLAEGIALMPEGSKYRFIVPPELGYGNTHHTPAEIGPNRTLVFEVELVNRSIE